MNSFRSFKKMVFKVENKVALITGGAFGLGLHYAKELLRNAAKGVVLADINPTLGQKAVEEIENEFGTGKAIFVKTDVSNIQSFEDAFKATIERFGNVDILINNAGLADDVLWEKEVAVNLNGQIHGVLLGLKNYLSKYKGTPEAVIVNVSSIAGTDCRGFSLQFPIYTATKYGVIGMTRSWGASDIFEQSKVRVIAICPGFTTSTAITNMTSEQIHQKNRYAKIINGSASDFSKQTPEFQAKELVKLIEYAPSGSVWVTEGGEPSYQFILPDPRTMKGNTLKH